MGDSEAAAGIGVVANGEDEEAGNTQDIEELGLLVKGSASGDAVAMLKDGLHPAWNHGGSRSVRSRRSETLLLESSVCPPRQQEPHERLEDEERFGVHPQHLLLSSLRAVPLTQGRARTKE